MSDCPYKTQSSHINGIHVPKGMTYDDISPLLELYGFKSVNCHSKCPIPISFRRENVEISIMLKNHIVLNYGDFLYADTLNFDNIYAVYTYLNDNYPQWRNDVISKHVNM